MCGVSCGRVLGGGGGGVGPGGRGVLEGGPRSAQGLRAGISLLSPLLFFSPGPNIICLAGSGLIWVRLLNSSSARKVWAREYFYCHLTYWKHTNITLRFAIQVLLKQPCSLSWGCMPRHVISCSDAIQAYHTYLQSELREETYVILHRELWLDGWGPKVKNSDHKSSWWRGYAKPPSRTALAGIPVKDLDILRGKRIKRVSKQLVL